MVNASSRSTPEKNVNRNLERIFRRCTALESPGFSRRTEKRGLGGAQSKAFTLRGDTKRWNCNLSFQSAGSLWGVKLTAAAPFAGTGGILPGVRRWLCRHTEEFKGAALHAKRLRTIAFILFAAALVMLLVKEIEIH